MSEFLVDYLALVLGVIIFSAFVSTLIGDFHYWLAGVLKQEKYRDDMLKDSSLVAFIFRTFGAILLLPYIIKFLVECLEIVLVGICWFFGFTGEYIRFMGEDVKQLENPTVLCQISKPFMIGIGSAIIGFAVLCISSAELLAKLTGGGSK